MREKKDRDQKTERTMKKERDEERKRVIVKEKFYLLLSIDC